MNSTYDKGLNAICGGLDLSPLAATVAENQPKSSLSLDSLMAEGLGLAPSALSAVLSGYHGYKRNNDSWVWGAGWSALAALASVGGFAAERGLATRPVLGRVAILPALASLVVPAVAVYQGFSKKAK
jgi:hypothetical protein